MLQREGDSAKPFKSLFNMVETDRQGNIDGGREGGKERGREKERERERERENKNEWTRRKTKIKYTDE